MKKSARYLFATLLLICIVSVFNSECAADVCKPYYGNGYCVDYIDYRFRTGTKQSGDAGTWDVTPGLTKDNVQANDVVIFGPTLTNSHGHVAVIDLVDGNNITISEWNFSNAYTLSTSNVGCGVSDNFHVTTSRTISKDYPGIKGFWHIGANLSNQSAQNPQYRLVGNVAWSPPNKSCHYASMWYFFSQGYPNGGQSIGYNSICQQEEYEMMMALGGVFSSWWKVLYSPADLVDNGICTQ